jgi:hypothetical protein
VSARATPAAAVRTTPARRKTALSGTRLDVTLERDGEVVRAANAEVNLPNLLATVLTTTRRDRGEIPFAVGKDGRLYTQTVDDKTKIEAIRGDFTKPDAPAGTSRVGDWIVVSTTDPTGSGLRFGVARPVATPCRPSVGRARAMPHSAWRSSASPSSGSFRFRRG